MEQAAGAAPSLAQLEDAASDETWRFLLAAAHHAERIAAAGIPAAFASHGESGWRAVPTGHPDALIDWVPEAGWQSRLAPDDPRRPLFDLYLPICSATAARPVTIAHLGQSLDGFIATHAGESRWVTGPANLLHMHRLRALSDAVIVGAGTIAADDPQLTTRLVHGSSPLRVVLDPARRLRGEYRVFNDATAKTLYVYARPFTTPHEGAFGNAAIAVVDGTAAKLNIAELVALLRARGCTRIFVEGGGVTVSMFLEANLLDRLHVTIAPLLIGGGRPSIRFTPPAALGDCHRPRYRVFQMGGDVLFDCELGTRARADDSGQLPALSRVI